MSRCFPFPPPGYERKTKVDDTDLLKKEKHKEKKHKKEKKDKEKKEGKDKREKERSDEKHRDKKDKKEKNRDKKKDKEKDRDKDRHKSDLLLSNEKKVVGSADNHVHKLSEKSKEKDRDKDRHKSDPLLSDEKKVVASAENHVHKIFEKSKEKETDRSPLKADKRFGGVSGVHNGMPVSKNNHQVHETKSFKHMPDSGRKSTDEEWRMPNQSFDKNVGTERKKDGVVLLAAKGEGLLQDTRERPKEKPALDGRLDRRGFIGDAKFTGSAVAPHSVGMVQNRVAGNRPVEKKVEQKVDGKEKSKEKGEKRKEKDRETSSSKDKDRSKVKDITKATPEEKHIQMTRTQDGSENNMLKSTVKDVNKKDITVVQNAGFYTTPKDSSYHAADANNNLRKRKDPGLNGIYDELVSGPNKMARASASPHSLTENGRSLEPCQNSSAQRFPLNIKVEPKLPHVDSMQKPYIKIKMDDKECKINGTVPEPCTQSSREKVLKAERKYSDAPAKPPPHPDTKYLSQVLSIPEMDEWSELDDLEWLFDSNSTLTRKPEGNSSSIDDSPRVWANGLWLEPVDVYALPYVIPH